MDPKKALGMSAEEYLQYMFESSQDGKLTVPRYYEDLLWHKPAEDPDGADYYDHYEIHWNEQDLAAIQAEFGELMEALTILAEKAKAFDEEKDFESDEEDVREFLQDERLFEVWKTYVRFWDTEGFALEQVAEYLSLDSRFDHWHDKLAIEKAMEEGFALDKDDLEHYESVKDTVVTEEEQADYDAFWEHLAADAARRVGDGPEALRIINRARRLWKCLDGAPEIIWRHEASELAQAMALHRFATEIENS